MTVRYRLCIADNHPIFRLALRQLCEEDTGLKIVGEASGGAELLELVNQCQPDIVVMDLSMPSMGGIETTKALREQGSPVKVLVLTDMNIDEFVVAAFDAGAQGYALKTAPAEEVCRAIRCIGAGRIYLAPELSAELTARVRPVETQQNRPQPESDPLAVAPRQTRRKRNDL